jgi:hypothetical protein
MRHIKLLAVAMAAAQQIAVSPHRVGKAIRKTRPGR